MLTLSPMSVAPVCRVGDPLQLTCTASATNNIQWRFTVANEQGVEEDLTPFSTAGALSNRSVIIQVNSTTFTLMRNSSRNDLPLIVTLSIDSVSTSLNGTVVSCIDPGNSTASASTTIQIIDTSNSESNNKHCLKISSFLL